MRDARAEWGTQGAALVLTLGLMAWVMGRDEPVRPPAAEAPKPTEAALSVIEEPPPQAAPPPPAPEPPVQAVPSLLPPPPRPRHIVRPRHPPPPHPVQQEVPPSLAPVSAAAVPSQAARQAPENHSAEGAYIGRLHALILRNTRPPETAAYRLNPVSGEVLVGFTLARGGGLSAVHVLRSSGHAAIDAQGVLIVSEGRYPPMPDDVYPGQSSHLFQIPVSITGRSAEGDL